MYRVTAKAGVFACALAAFAFVPAAMAQQAQEKSTLGEIINLLKEWAKSSGTSEEDLGEQISRALKGGDTDKALDAVLKQRESWGTEPSSQSEIAASTGTNKALDGNTENALKTLLEQRAAWSKDTATTMAVATTAAECQSKVDAVLATNTIGFQPSSANYTAGAATTIETIARTLKNCRATALTVEGHTDSSGRKAANDLLSRDRAKTVADALRKKGLSNAKITAVGHGSSKPVAPNDTAENKAKNRRIVIAVNEVAVAEQAETTAAAPAKAKGDNQATLKALMAQREAWARTNRTTAFNGAAAQQSKTPSGKSALEQLLAERASWGTKPFKTSRDLVAAAIPSPGSAKKTEAKAPASALEKLLAERSSWGKMPSLTSADTVEDATSEAKTKSTASARKTAIPSRADIDDALKAHLKQRKTWGAKPTAGARATKGVTTKAKSKTAGDPLKALLAQRESWKSVKATTGSPGKGKSTTASLKFASKPSKLGAPVDDALSALLAERECWAKKGVNCSGQASGDTKTAALDGKPAASGPVLNASACQNQLNAVLKPGWISFEPDSSAFDDAGRTNLDNAAKILQRCGGLYVRIEGHTDASGNAAANKRLSLRRANAVAAYLSRAGVTRTQLKTIGLGASKPVAPNDSAENKARNRRIEFQVLAN